MNQPEIPRGRPRSEQARTAILTATRDLLREAGYDRLTMVDVAARAGTGKQTVYRWWPTKAELVTDCVLEGLVDLDVVTAAVTGAPAADLTAWLLSSYDAIASEETAPLMHALTAAAATSAAAARALAERFNQPLDSAIGEVVRRGVETGELRAGIDVHAISDLLVGALVLAVLTRDRDAVERVPAMVDALMIGLRAR